MKPVIFTRDCTFKGKSFSNGQKLNKMKKEDLSDIWKLNEKGFIQPLSEDEFLEIARSFGKKNKAKEEEK